MTDFEKYQQIVEDNKEFLLEADKRRKNPELRKALHYFAVQKHRGNIKEVPSLKNGYSIEKTERRIRNEQIYI